MEVVAKAMGLVVVPLSLVNITILVKQSAIAIGLVVLPVALVERAIGPNLDTLSLTG